MSNPMQEIYIDKVVVHMGVGESGERLVKAEKIMQQITGQKPVRTIAKGSRSIPIFRACPTIRWSASMGWTSMWC